MNKSLIIIEILKFALTAGGIVYIGISLGRDIALALFFFMWGYSWKQKDLTVAAISNMLQNALSEEIDNLKTKSPKGEG